MPIESPALLRRRGIFTVLAAASVLLLSTGCTADLSGGFFGGGSGSGSSSNADGSGKDGDGKDGDGKDGGNSANGDGSASGTLTGRECLPGNWIFDNDGFEKFMGSLSGNFDIAVTGHVVLTLSADGRTHTNYDQWTHNISTGEGRAVVVRHGIDKGTFTVSGDGTMTMNDTSIGSITSMTIHAEGQTIKRTVEPEPSLFTQGAFACSGDTLEITVDGFTAVMHREH